MEIISDTNVPFSIVFVFLYNVDKVINISVVPAKICILEVLKIFSKFESFQNLKSMELVVTVFQIIQ